jgi:hypothetical protein
MVKVMEKIADKGHVVIPNFRGGLSGHRCTRCDLFRCQASYAYWSEGPICTPKASSLERKEDFISDQLQKRRKTEEVAITKWKTESVAAEAKIKPVTFEAKRPTREDEQELVDLNKTPFVIRVIPFLGRNENLEHEPTSDLGYSLPGVGVLGAGRSIGLFGPRNLVSSQGKMQIFLY